MEQLEQTLTSLEVAEMMNKKHYDLMRDIRRYSVQMDKANENARGESKIAFSDFFTESTYQTEQGKVLPCYKITKKGCEFIAHKMTGVKGTAFTARYINRFHDMEKKIEIDSQAENRHLPPPRKKISWYNQNKEKFMIICKRYGWERKYLYHKILLEIGRKYDLEETKYIYRKENGCFPDFATEIIEYFPELQTAANTYIDYLLEKEESNRLDMLNFSDFGADW